MSDLAVAADVIGMFRPLSDAETTLAESLILRASAMLRNNAPTIDARIAAGTLDPVLASTAVAQMVIRVLKNPNSYRQQTTGPFSVTYDKDWACGFLTVLQADLDTIADTSAESRPPASTITVRPGFRHHDGRALGGRCGTTIW